MGVMRCGSEVNHNCCSIKEKIQHANPLQGCVCVQMKKFSERRRCNDERKIFFGISAIGGHCFVHGMAEILIERVNRSNMPVRITDPWNSKTAKRVISDECGEANQETEVFDRKVERLFLARK